MAWEGAASAATDSEAAPSLEVVTGGGRDPEAMTHGLRAVRELLASADACCSR
jgi:hypothetical protein